MSGNRHGDGGAAVVNGLLEAAARLDAMQEKYSLEELWKLVASGSAQGSGNPSDRSLGSSHHVMRMHIQEFAAPQLRAEVFAVLVLYQLVKSGAPSVTDARFSLSVREVLAIEEDGNLSDSSQQKEVSSAIVAVAKEKMVDVLRDGATFQETDDRLSSGVVRVYKACEKHEAPPSANAGAGADLASIMQQIVASLGSAAGAAGASASSVPEAADDLKRVKHEEFVLKLVKRLQDAGEASLPRQDRITHTMLWKLHKRLVEGGRVPDVEDGDNELTPYTMHALHAEFWGQKVQEEEEHAAAYVSGEGSLKMRNKPKRLTFSTAEEYAKAVRRFLMNMWFVAFDLKDVADRSDGAHKVGRVGGVVKYAPREEMEEVSHMVMYCATLCGNRLQLFDHFVNSTLSLVARQHNHVHGALTLGAAAREGREFLRTLIVTAQTAGTLPLRADGTKSAVLAAAPVQPSAPSPFLMPPPAYTAPSAPLFSQMGFGVQGVDSLNLRDFRRVKAGGRGRGAKKQAAMVQGAVNYDQSGARANAQDAGRGGQGGGGSVVVPSPGALIQQGKDATTGRWLSLPGGNPYCPQACSFPHAKAASCWKNHMWKT